MTTQIAIRLDDDLVEYLDRKTSSGEAESRAAVVRVALRRLIREEAHRRDAEIYAREGSDPDLLALTSAAAAQLPDLDG